jgi:hypothetical protein
MPDKNHLKSRDFEGYAAERSRFSLKKLVLFILSIIFDILVLLSIIFLVTGRLHQVPGSILLIVSIGLSLLCKSLWRRSIVRLGTVIILFIVAVITTTTFCAYAGIEPFASLKNELFTRASEIVTKSWEKLVSVIEFLRIFLIDKK